jgi:electron transport complex protein RnfC
MVGLGGAGFPTHIKLNPPADKKVDTIIVNAAECEPYLTTDYRVLLEQSYELKRGLQIILKMFPEARGIIGIETNKMPAIKRMREVCGDDGRIAVVPLRPKYPQGCEKQLIEAAAGRQVPSGKLPADAGCIVSNVDTVIAIDRCIHRGRPLMRKVVTVVGGALIRPGNYKVRLGMSVASLIGRAGGFKERPAKIIAGGPMMGVALYDLNAPIIKTSSAVLCFTEAEARLPKEQNCIRCGKCVDHCPAGLMPLELNYYAINHDEAAFKRFNGLDCVECGSCSFVCPAKRHLAQSIRATRRAVMAKR